jgi:transposase
VVKATGARFGFNMISAVNAGGSFRFMTVEGTVNATVFCQFLERLIAGQKRKIFLIVDGHPSHKAKVVKRLVQEQADRIELCFLPPDSPDLNPDELVWNHVKARVAKATVQTKDEMKAAVSHVLHRLRKLPHIVAGFFRTPSCAYAAA